MNVDEDVVVAEARVADIFGYSSTESTDRVKFWVFVSLPLNSPSILSLAKMSLPFYFDLLSALGIYSGIITNSTGGSIPPQSSSSSF